MKKIVFFLSLIFMHGRQDCYGQKKSFDKVDRELTVLYAKIFPFYYGNNDSLNYYSDLFSTRLSNFINENPLTLNYKFKSLSNNACGMVTSADKLFRIYSWDTWLGGTMHDFKNIFQFKSGDKVFATGPDSSEADFGTDFKDIFTLKTIKQTYYLAVSGGSESTKDAYETISIYTISNNKLDDKVKLIKTATGLNNSISFEYDFFSVAGRPERPIRLIKYNADKKIISIPVVLENGKVTDRFILYQFNGRYFEKVLVKK